MTSLCTSLRNLEAPSSLKMGPPLHTVLNSALHMYVVCTLVTIPAAPQIIAFYNRETGQTSPLTLILGQNGCGKTTIIECLKERHEIYLWKMPDKTICSCQII